MARPITSLEGFVRKIRKLFEDHKHQNLFFRGHPDKTFELTPSVFRSGNLTRSEHLMIRQLVAEQPGEFQGDQTNFDRLVRAQHYGLPTRLLDVSSNPLVALYFSIATHKGQDGQVIVLTPEINKQKYYDSDSVSLLCALSFMKHEDKDAVRDAIRRIWSKAPTVIDPLTPLPPVLLEEFNDDEAIRRLVQIVRVEKPEFRPIVDPIDLVKIVSVVPRKTHDRIRAQSGGFLIFGLGARKTDLNMPDVTVETFNISKESKQKIERELGSVGISEEALFPEIERNAIQIKRRYS